MEMSAVLWYDQYTVYDLYLRWLLVWRFGGVALQPPIIVSPNSAKLLGAVRTLRR